MHTPVLVAGAGPIGLSAVEFARLSGARVIVMDRVAPRLAFVSAANLHDEGAYHARVLDTLLTVPPAHTTDPQ